MILVAFADDIVPREHARKSSIVRGDHVQYGCAWSVCLINAPGQTAVDSSMLSDAIVINEPTC